MAGRFPPAWLDELRARADIVQVVSSYLPLKKNGHRYWGLCPFHNEKTASFSVDSQRQMYYCFGCKAGGSVIQFVMDVEHMDFTEAVLHLAERLHITPPEIKEDEAYQAARSQKERLLSANRAAAQYYHQQLFTKEGEPILSYLKGRGLDDGVIRKFGLGAALYNRDGLTEHLLSQGFTLEELQKAGLTLLREGKTIDMFRSRAMFPIIDLYGQVLGFGGRAMGDAKPKYLNTSDTPAFNKRLGVYAANLMRKARNLQRVILVEGYMDVVALSQFGVEGVVATLGTSLTQEQARLLKRFAPQIWVAYDGDSAGQHATLRALDIFEAEAIPARVLAFPDKLDPDEFIRRDGLEAFHQLTPLSAAAYRMDRKAEEFDLSNQDGRTEYAKACSEILRRVTQPVELENHLQRLVLQTGFPKEVLQAQIGIALPIAKNSVTPQRERLSTRTEEKLGRAEQSLISLLATGRLPQGTITEEEFKDPFMRQLCQGLLNGLTPAELMENQADEKSRSLAAEIFATPVEGEPDTLMRMAEDCLDKLRRQRIEAKLAELKQQMTTLAGREKEAALHETVALMQRLNQLKPGK